METITYNGTSGRYVHEISAVLMVIVITLQSQFASLAQKCLRRTKLMKLFMCLMHIFIRWSAEETSIGHTNVSLNGDSFS